MANIYDMNAAIERPNFLATALGGLQAGQQQRQLREQRADEATLRGLAPAIMGGDPAALEQAAVIDPARAGQFKAAGDVKWQTLKGGYDLVKRAQASGNPQAVQSAWTAFRPFVQRATGVAPPEDFATAAPYFDQLGVKLAMIQGGQVGNVQSTQVLANGNIGIVTRDGRVVDTGQAAAPTTQLINEPGQVPYLVTTGRGAVGNTTAIGPGGQAAPQNAPTSAPPIGPQGAAPGLPVSVDAEAALGNDLIAAGVPPAQVDAILAARAARSNAQPGAPAMGAPVPQRNPTAAEVERDKAAAREQVELGFLPQRNALEAQGAGMTTAAQEAARTAALPAQQTIAAAGAGQAQEAKDRAQVRVELEQLLPKVRSDSERAIALIDKALKHPGRAASTGLSSLNPLNLVPGSDAMNFKVLLDQLKGGTFLQAFQSLKGGGAITQVEGQKAEQAIARLNTAQSDAEFIAALEDLRAVAASLPVSIQQKLMAAGASQGGAGSPSRPTSEADYNALPSGALFIDPDDGRTYRKP